MTEQMTRAPRAAERVRALREDDRSRVFRAMGLATPERGGAPWLHDWADGGIAAQTRVLTLDGAIPAGELMVGDRLITRDSGAATLRWIGRVDLGSARLRAAPPEGASPTSTVPRWDSTICATMDRPSPELLPKAAPSGLSV